MTAAHCTMEVRNQSYNKISQAYILNPITSCWYNIDVNNIYIDGVGDIALIKTNIDLTNYPNYCLKLADTDANAGDICYIIGNPGGFDEDSISIGCVRDPNYCDPEGYQIVDSIFVKNNLLPSTIKA